MNPTTPSHTTNQARPHAAAGFGSVLAWPAWLRVLVVLPVVALLWLGLWWASAGSTPW